MGVVDTSTSTVATHDLAGVANIRGGVSLAPIAADAHPRPLETDHLAVDRAVPRLGTVVTQVDDEH